MFKHLLETITWHIELSSTIHQHFDTIHLYAGTDLLEVSLTPVVELLLTARENHELNNHIKIKNLHMSK